MQMFQGAFEHAMIGMALVAPDGRWLRVNRALCALLDYEERELLAAGFRPLLEDEGGTAGGDALAALLRGTGVAYESERRFVTGGGVARWLRLSVSLVHDEAGQPEYLIVQAQDITADREAEAQRTVLLQRLERSNQELERFAAIASHDLQEPLRKIRAFSDRLVATEAERLSERGRDYLGRMHQTSARMQELIGGMLAYSRASNEALNVETVELDAVVRDALRDLDTALTRTAGRVEIGPLPAVAGDPLRLRQLFQNLLANALKFHRPGVPPIIAIGAERAPCEEGVDGAARSCWRIAVTDNGIGFEPQYGERIFGMFQRLNGRSQYEGSGIGLALCRQIAERHGGRIAARGEPGGGATFVVLLPVAESEERSS